MARVISIGNQNFENIIECPGEDQSPDCQHVCQICVFAGRGLPHGAGKGDIPQKNGQYGRRGRGDVSESAFGVSLPLLREKSNHSAG